MRMLKEFLTHNWLAKLSSIVLATLLWMTIQSQANSEVGMTVPLEYRNIPSRLEVVGDTTNTVEVRLRGSSTLIRQISPRDVSATVDLGGLPPGEKIIQLSGKNVKSAFGIEVVRVNPSQVRFNLERTMSKKIPVVLRVDGEPAPGYELDGMTVTPAQVEVEGPESKVSTIETVPTAVINMTGRKEAFAGPVDLDLPDPMLRLHFLSPVDVRINVRPIRGGK